jgi:hypothetical protein
MPLLVIYAWMAFVYIAIISVFIWKAPSELPVVIPMGFLSSVGFCFIMRFLEMKRVEAGPYAIISDHVWNYEKRNVKISDIKEAAEVFFSAKTRSGKESYRVLVLSGTDFSIPIMWQIANQHKWTRPKLDLVEKRLGIKAISIQLNFIMEQHN